MTINWDLTCLHGFLGRASDWQSVFSEERPKNYVDLWSLSQELFENDSLSLESLARKVANADLPKGSSRKVLLGYSFGGRVALEVLSQAELAEQWDALIFVSTHPGIAFEEKNVREDRLIHDQKWAERLRGAETWDSFWADWNRQGVFGEKPVPERFAFSAVERKNLANVLTHCSLGLQSDHRENLKKAKVPILWVVGKEDAKFLALSKEVANLNPQVQVRVVENTFHRVPWEKPKVFCEILNEFLENLETRVHSG